MSDEGDGLDQTLYFQTHVYEDQLSTPIPIDLCSACALGNYDCVQEAISAGRGIDAANKVGWTPLMYASYVGHDTVVNLLLEAGAQPNKATPGGLSPLMVASGCGNESVCYFLVHHGADVDARDSSGYPALFHAIRQGHQITVQLLLESGANLELTDDSHGYTGLMLAALEGDEIIVDFLIACGADIHARDKEEHSARSLAQAHHHVRTVSLLDDALGMFDAEQNFQSEGGGERAEAGGDLFSGAKEMEAYQQSMAVKRLLRSGPRHSLPQDLFVQLRRGSAPAPNTQRTRRFRAALSMPERDFPPGMGERDGERLEVLEEEPSVDPQLLQFLAHLGLEKYAESFGRHEILSLSDLLSLSEEDLKRVGIKVGSRRKISLALQELLGQQEEKRSPSGPALAHGGGAREESGARGRGRPPLHRQPSTELQEAYREAMKHLDELEAKLRGEHQLRSTTESYLAQLQAARARVVAGLDGLQGSQADVSTHTEAVRSTHCRLTRELDSLRTLLGSSSPEVRALLPSLLSLGAREGLELEALARSLQQACQCTASLATQLKAHS